MGLPDTDQQAGDGEQVGQCSSGQESFGDVSQFDLEASNPDLVQLLGCVVPCTLDLLPFSTCCYVLDFHTLFFAQPPS